MKCLSKGCQNTSFLLTVALCYPCMQLVENPPATKNKAVTKRKWNSLTDYEIAGFAHDASQSPVFIMETTDKGLCIKFSESIDVYCSDNKGDYAVVHDFLMKFARAVELSSKNKNT